MGNIKGITNYAILGFVMVLLVVFALPANAGINFNYTNVTPRNYTITDTVMNSENFVRLIGGNIEMPTVNLFFSIDNTTLVSGPKSVTITSSRFGPKTTNIPAQKVYIASADGNATINYYIDASAIFKNASVNISTYSQISNTVPFFSDLSVALLDFNDLKNKWSNKSKVLDDLVNTASDQSKINETKVNLNSGGDSVYISQNLPAGNYLILVTKGTDPKEIITFTIVRVMPFTSTITVPSTGTAGSDINVGVSLSSAPSGNYTYITSIINREDYSDNIGNVNITWSGRQNLSQATRINGIVLADANALTDIIPRSNTTRTTINSTTATLTLKTGALPAGSYFLHTIVFNSSNQSVAFNQSSFTLTYSTPVLTAITVSPLTESFVAGNTASFTAAPKDQNGNAFTAT
ncbi:MAG: TIGR04279 domain-containing protein, partial [Candidatus Methanoperedens sp.]|nr:TIGR04279 domain-containing protein [Candidatus Methanoperedens sp.]